MHRSHFADRVRAFLLAAALVSALICPQALAADAAGSGGCAHGHTLTTCHGGKSVCAVCGETVGIRAAQYTGWLTVEGTADRMYFLSGEHVTGWQQLDGGTYHFDDDGIVHDTETVDTRTCTTNGYAITTCRTCGETCRSAVLRYAGHSWDADHVCTKCGTQGKNIADAQVKTAPAVYNGKDAVCAVAVTYQGRQLTVRTDEADVDGCISYTNNTRVGLGTVSIRGMRDFYGTVSAQYEILPGGVRDAAAAEIGQKQVRLDWTAAAGAENYRVEMSADGGSTWTALPLTAKPVCIVTGLAPATAYTFRLAGCTQVDGRWYFSPYYSNTVTVTTLPEGAFAPSELLGTIDAQVDGRTVTGLSMDAAQYLFLPASADLSRLAVTVHTQNCTNPTVELQGSKGIEPLGETVNITELAAADDGLYTLTVRINGEAAGTLCVAQSENLSALYIRAKIRPHRAEPLWMPAMPTPRRSCCWPTGTAMPSVTVCARSSVRAAGPTLRPPGSGRISSGSTRRVISPPAGKRLSAGRCWPAVTTQRFCTTSSSGSLPCRWACRTHPRPTGWICTMTASTAALILSARRTPSAVLVWTLPAWRPPTRPSTRTTAAI